MIKEFRAYATIIAGMTRVFAKPDFGIGEIVVDNVTLPVIQKTVLAKAFCNLINFECATEHVRPKMLLVAPMSGHYATLLRQTVIGMLPEFDVYITDWANARDVPLSEGEFGLDDYVDYVRDFFDVIQPSAVTAVCQPGPAVAAALALQAEDGKRNPDVAIFMGSPMDTDASETKVTAFAKQHNMSWFKSNLLAQVPAKYAGDGRLVYPGQLQLSSFMGMNLDVHVQKYIEQMRAIVAGEQDKVDAHNRFYDEYLTVSDLPARFYLDTVQKVFKENTFAKGTFTHRGRLVNLGALRDTALFAVEGANDDITGIGQVSAILDMCPNVPRAMKDHLLVAGVGHYGIFSGSKFLYVVMPKITALVHAHSGPNAVQTALTPSVTPHPLIRGGPVD